MPEWLENGIDWLRALTWAEALLLSAALFVVMFFGSIAAVTCILVKLPADYFQNDHPHALADQHPVIRWIGLVLKNLLGVTLVLIGIVLALPGVPGQGILTMLLGVMLLSLPGKRRCEQWLVSRRRVRAAIDRIRGKFGKPPLVLDGDPPI